MYHAQVDVIAYSECLEHGLIKFCYIPCFGFCQNSRSIVLLSLEMHHSLAVFQPSYNFLKLGFTKV